MNRHSLRLLSTKLHRALATPCSPVPIPVLGGSLVNELDALDSPLVLVLNDYHRIEPASSVHEFLRFLLEHPPPALRLVLATRSDPPFSTGSLRGRGRLAEVRLHTGLALGKQAGCTAARFLLFAMPWRRMARTISARALDWLYEKKPEC